MALIKCPECGNEISDSAKKCIHCGYTVKKEKKVIVPILIGVLSIVLLVGAFFILKSKGIINIGNNAGSQSSEEIAEENSILNEFPEFVELFSIDSYPEADKWLSSRLEPVNSLTRKNNTDKTYSNTCTTDYEGVMYIDKQTIELAEIVYYDEDNQIDEIYIRFNVNSDRVEKYKEFAIELFGDDYTEYYLDGNEFAAYWKDGSAILVSNPKDNGMKRINLIKGFCGSQMLGTNTRYKKK